MNCKILIANTALLPPNLLDNQQLLKELLSQLPAYRREKFMALKPEKSKLLSLTAGLLLNKALSLYDIIPGKCTYQLANGQKPYIAEYKDICFNLTHSGTYAGCIIGSCDLGLDIEKQKEYREAVANRFFSAEENSFIQSQPDKVRSFYRLWTLKESFMKVTGLGMQLPLNDFCINIKPDLAPTVTQKVDNNYYFFREYFDIEGYSLSACSKRDNLPENIEIVKDLWR